MAGIVPGIVLASMLGLTPGTARARTAIRAMPQATWGERLQAFRDSFWGVMLIVIVLGGIYTGLFTPTEAAAMSAVYAFIVAVFVYKDLSLKRRPAGAARLGQHVGDAALHHHQRGAVLVPDDAREHPAGDGRLDPRHRPRLIELPADRQPPAAARRQRDGAVVDRADHGADPVPGRVKLGIDPVHFGILIMVNMEIGMCHPPVGLNLYVASGITKMGITELTIAVWPWLLTMLGFLVSSPTGRRCRCGCRARSGCCKARQPARLLTDGQEPASSLSGLASSAPPRRLCMA